MLLRYGQNKPRSTFLHDFKWFKSIRLSIPHCKQQARAVVCSSTDYLFKAGDQSATPTLSKAHGQATATASANITLLNNCVRAHFNECKNAIVFAFQKKRFPQG